MITIDLYNTTKTKSYNKQSRRLNNQYVMYLTSTLAIITSKITI